MAQGSAELLKSADTKRKNGLYGAAIEEYSAYLEEYPNSAEAYRGRAYSRRKMSNWQGAVADYDKALALNASNASAYLGRAQARLRLGQYDVAAQDWENYLRLSPNAPFKASVRYNLAYLKHKNKDAKGALAAYNEILKEFPEHLPSLVNRGFLLYQQRDIRPACADWLKAMRLGNAKAKRNAAQACKCCM